MAAEEETSTSNIDWIAARFARMLKDGEYPKGLGYEPVVAKLFGDYRRRPHGR